MDWALPSLFFQNALRNILKRLCLAVRGSLKVPHSQLLLKGEMYLGTKVAGEAMSSLGTYNIYGTLIKLFIYFRRRNTPPPSVRPYRAVGNNEFYVPVPHSPVNCELNKIFYL